MDHPVRRSARLASAVTLASVTTLTGLTACGSSGDTSQTTDTGEATTSWRGTETPAPDPLTGAPITDSAVIQSLLLTTAELPEGYTVIPDPVRDLGLDPAPDYDSPDMSGTDPDRCADVLAPIAEQHAGASADGMIRYSGPNFSSIDEDAASYPDDGAAQAFEAVQDTFAACAAFSGTDADGFDVDYELEPREQDSVGDASTSVRMTTTSEGFALVSEAVIAVVDHAVVQVVVTSQEGADAEAVTDLSRAAVEKIRGANTGV